MIINPNTRRATRLVAMAVVVALATACSPSEAPAGAGASGDATDAPAASTQAPAPAEPALASAPVAGTGVMASDAWMRAMPPGAQVAGGFLTLRNGSAEADRLVAVESPAAARVEVHEMRTVDGMMRMRHLADGLALPAGAEVTLAPGGYHLMFMQPGHSFAEGETVPATLVFEHAGKVEVAFRVLALGAAGPDDAPADTGDVHAGH